jgi:hypothetical protein
MAYPSWLEPLKGGVDKLPAAHDAKVRFSWEKYGFFESGARGFINKQSV